MPCLLGLQILKNLGVIKNISTTSDVIDMNLIKGVSLIIVYLSVIEYKNICYIEE